MKSKIVLIEIAIILLLTVIGITYSLYVSDSDLSGTQSIAKFVFNTEETSLIELPLNNLIPGSESVYDFSVTNSSDDDVSDVTLDYQITIRTLNTIPLSYELIKDGDVLMTCDGSYSRDLDNLVVCNGPVTELVVETSSIHDYQLKVIFPSEYNDIKYANLVDYVDIEINSWQRVDS